MIQKNLLALIFINKCLLKRFKTEGNTYSLKKFFLYYNKRKMAGILLDTVIYVSLVMLIYVKITYRQTDRQTHHKV